MIGSARTIPDMDAEPLQEVMAPIFTGPADVGVGVAVDVAVAVGVGPDVAVAVGVGVGVAVSVGVVRVGVGLAFSFPPQAANIGNIKTKARPRAINLYQELLFGHMVNHLPLRHH